MSKTWMHVYTGTTNNEALNHLYNEGALIYYLIQEASMQHVFVPVQTCRHHHN